jgi:hypothetical protein
MELISSCDRTLVISFLDRAACGKCDAGCLAAAELRLLRRLVTDD